MIIKKLVLLICVITGIQKSIAATHPSSHAKKSTSSQQSPQISGKVYAGAQLYNSPFNGMQIKYIVFYFKGDGTFNDDLKRTDWRTAATGNYKIAGGMVTLTYKNGDDPDRYKLTANGKLESTAGIKHTLHQVKKVTAIPAGSYEKKSASVSGGIGTNMPMVGAFSSDFLHFDGKGNFTGDRESVVGVSGDGFAGKSEKNGKSSGTYKLGDGEITMTLANGTSGKHSFFYSPPGQEDLVLLDGDFYFKDDEKEGSSKGSTRRGSVRSSGTRAAAGKTNADAKASAAGLPTAADVLAKLRVRYGGADIDKISTVRETATITGGMQAVVITDIANNRIRAEIRQNGTPLLIKQLTGNDGWQWIKGQKKELTPAGKEELKLNLYLGVMGLHQKLNSGISNGTVTASGNDYMLTFYQSKSKLIYLVGNDYSLKGNAYSINEGKPNISVYKKFTSAGGITYPAVTESTDGTSKMTMTTTTLEINPALPAESWKMPDYLR